MTVPRDLSPMLATAGPLPPDDPAWSYEVKWDGVRALVAVRDGGIGLRSRAGNDLTGAYPELEGRRPGDLVLDGEVVAFDESGRPDFGLLQSRMHVRGPAPALRAATPVTLVLFDVLAVDGALVVDRTYDERRALLAALDLVGGGWTVPPAFPGQGAGLLASTRAQGLEGVVAKRRAGRYWPGRRSDSWVKAKNLRRQSAVVVGWRPGEGGRAGQLGSLLLAVQGDGGLVFAGHVGTGFSTVVLPQLAAVLAPLATTTPTCQVPREHARSTRWVRPELVAEVEHTAWTRDGRLRHASYKGLRDDLDPGQVVREPW